MLNNPPNHQPPLCAKRVDGSTVRHFLAVTGLSLLAMLLTATNAIFTSQIASADASSDESNSLTHTSSSSRQIAAPGRLYVRRLPSPHSPIVGVVAAGQWLTVEIRTQGGWLGVSAPVDGYVFSRYFNLVKDNLAML